MSDLQSIFEVCREAYKKCYDNVKAMSCSIARIMEKKGIEWDPKITSGKFDIILQYSLLQIAAADYDFDRNEMIFIRDLTEQGDLVNYMNSITKPSITWEELYDCSVIEIRAALRRIEGIMVNLSDEFINVFAICDVATEYNYLYDLEDNILLIIAGLAKMDGAITDSELNQGCLIIGAINKIKKLKSIK